MTVLRVQYPRSFERASEFRDRQIEGELVELEALRERYFPWCPPEAWDTIQADELFDSEYGEPVWGMVGVTPPENRVPFQCVPSFGAPEKYVRQAVYAVGDNCPECQRHPIAILVTRTPLEEPMVGYAEHEQGTCTGCGFRLDDTTTTSWLSLGDGDA